MTHSIREVQFRRLKKYWMVHDATRGGATAVRHATPHEAVQEARRLAALNPQEDFVVLEAMAAFRAVLPTPLPKTKGRVL